MEWNVLLHNANSTKMEKWNVFRHSGFAQDVEKLLVAGLAKDHFAELLQQRLRYYFGSRAEYEIVATSWPPYMSGADIVKIHQEYEDHKATRGKYPYRLDVALEVGQKIDAADQVMLNFDAFVDYVLNYKED